MAVLPKHADLKQTYDKIWPELQPADRDRLRRALSWLDRAEQCSDDDDRFLFLWISFSAAYGTPKESNSTGGELELSSSFLRKIVELDGVAMGELMEARIGDSINYLVTNRYVFQPFWAGNRNWKRRFDQQNAKLQEDFKKRNVAATFHRVLQRLHVLRNQIVHGGATWKSKVNRRQVEDGTYIMQRLVPTVLGIMLRRMAKNPAATWGSVAWPSVPGAYDPAPSDDA